MTPTVAGEHAFPRDASPWPGVIGPESPFTTRTALALSAIQWVGWLFYWPRGVVSSGLQRELDELGVGAVKLVAAASILVGLIATFQVASQLSIYGAEMLSGRAIGWFAARELGPLSVAVLVIARSAAGIAGEFASMAANGEIDALRAMGLDPAKYLVAPKLAALIVAMPALTILADGLIVLGGWIGNTIFLGYSTAFFLEQFRHSFSVADLFIGLGKSVMFAFILGLIASQEGLMIDRRAGRIGRAATRAVVFSLLVVLAADTLVNAVFYFIPGLA